MGKKSRRVRDGTQYSGVKTHIVLWKSGTAIKKTLSVDLARGGTFKDMKLTLESVTSVPVAMMLMPRFGAEGLPGALKGVRNWPRFRPYWRRVRRRVCAHCAKRADLSEPRYLVCAGCGKARYCSEACQRADWAEHQKVCPAGQPGWNAAVDSR